MMSYDFSNTENIEKEFYNKYNIMIDNFNLEYQNVYNFEKYKWGGVRLEHLSYIYFDLREFSKIDFEFNPTKEDINIFNAILERIDSYNMKNDSN